MNTNADVLLNRLVVAALTMFVVVCLLLAALIAREIWVQQHLAGLSDSVQVNLEGLEQTTEEIQGELTDMRTAPDSVAEKTENLVDLLDGVDQQLEAIKENMDEVSTMLEPEAPVPLPSSQIEPELLPVQDRADQVFTIFVLLISVVSIAIAALLAVSIYVEERVALGDEGLPKQPAAG